MSIVAAVVMAATKNNMLDHEVAPFRSTAEPRVLRWLAEQFEQGPKVGDGMLAGGTLANLQALTTARNAKSECHELSLERPAWTVTPQECARTRTD